MGGGLVWVVGTKVVDSCSLTHQQLRRIFYAECRPLIIASASFWLLWEWSCGPLKCIWPWNFWSEESASWNLLGQRQGIWVWPGFPLLKGSQWFMRWWWRGVSIGQWGCWWWYYWVVRHLPQEKKYVDSILDQESQSIFFSRSGILTSHWMMFLWLSRGRSIWVYFWNRFMGRGGGGGGSAAMSQYSRKKKK